MWIHCPRTQVFVSEEAFVHINWLNKIQMIQMFSPFSSLFFLLPFFVESPLTYIALSDSSSPYTF